MGIIWMLIKKCEKSLNDVRTLDSRVNGSNLKFLSRVSGFFHIVTYVFYPSARILKNKVFNITVETTMDTLDSYNDSLPLDKVSRVQFLKGEY